ncbi:uncharacterized protein PSFLO_03062 [Pseudozyma flocculosa]|uniref:Uncharacterized protein n=1 Tax=Pseudozyma flocculosa TaxID=84751 RepID=A0A5C3F1J5_9BASI|nr:uncharacterized protein PSFLO_03062 [Pseudozyma flocculosa]
MAADRRRGLGWQAEAVPVFPASRRDPTPSPDLDQAGPGQAKPSGPPLGKLSVKSAPRRVAPPPRLLLAQPPLTSSAPRFPARLFLDLFPGTSVLHCGFCIPISPALIGQRNGARSPRVEQRQPWPAPAKLFQARLRDRGPLLHSVLGATNEERDDAVGRVGSETGTSRVRRTEEPMPDGRRRRSMWGRRISFEASQPPRGLRVSAPFFRPRTGLPTSERGCQAVRPANPLSGPTNSPRNGRKHAKRARPSYLDLAWPGLAECGRECLTARNNGASLVRQRLDAISKYPNPTQPAQLLPQPQPQPSHQRPVPSDRMNIDLLLSAGQDDSPADFFQDSRG